MSIYKGSRKIKDIYFGTPNTNCLTYIPQDINLTLDPLNVTVTGSPTVSRGVVSGFSASNYVTLPKVFNPSSANNWEVVLKFNIPSNPSNWLSLLGNGNSTDRSAGIHIFYDSSRRIRLECCTSGAGSWNICNLTGTTSMALNTDYWVKAEFTGSAYNIYLSTDGETFNSQGTASSTSKVGATATQCIGNSLSHSGQFHNGSIDLSQSYIKVNGSTWWKGGTGIMTLKAGSKVYVPNGSGVFDVVNITSDKVLFVQSAFGTGKGLIFYNRSSSDIVPFERCFSGSTQPTFTGNTNFWYDTANNKIKYTENKGSSFLAEDVSLPLGICSFDNGTITSIDQVFNGFGYIGGALFVLPNVEGNGSDGLNPDGTYKIIPFKTSTVILRTDPTSNTSLSYALQNKGTSLTRYDHFTLKEDGYLYAPDGRKIYGVDIGKVVYENFKITSLTPNPVQPEKIARKIARVYKGSTLVYGYAPNSTIFEQTTAGDYSLDVKVDGYYQLWLVGGGGGGAFNSSGNHGSSAAGNSGGYVNVKAYLKKGSYTITVGAGGKVSGGLDFSGWGGDGSSSIIKLNDNTLVLAGGGTGNHVWWKDGYAYNEVICIPNEINSDNFTLTETIENQVGNAGGLGGNGSSPTGGASTYGGYGKGGNVYNRNSADDGVAGYVKVVAI